MYEKTKNTDWFRIVVNCLPVSGKIVFAARDFYDETEDEFKDEEDFLWATDRAGYILSLASLQRCIESFRRLLEKDQNLKIDTIMPNALKFQNELIDRLEEIQQKFLKSQKN